VLEQAELLEEPAAPLETPGEDEQEGENDAPVERKLTKVQRAELLRQTVDTVGKVGQPGEQIQNVISVGMLSEGWDAKTVTHIMGLRAFTSQLLCEQVVGRGLRRTAYEVNPKTGLFEPEYVNIFGVPFTFLPHEGGEDSPPPPPTPKTAIEPDRAKAEFEIRWLNVVRIERVFQPRLTLDWSKARPLELDAAQTAQVAELAPILEGKPDVTRINRIELERLAREFRTQRIIFETARDVFDQMKHTWQGSREVLLAQLVQIVEGFIRSDRIAISPPLFYQDELRRRLIITLNMSRVVQHLWEAVRQENTEKLTPVFDRDHPIRSTGDMRTWYTGKPCERTKKSHINVCVYDSTWEASDAFVLDDSDAVAAWAKNDHLGFEILYVYRGVVRKYRPDFLVRLKNGDMLVLETKGQDTEQDRVKRRYLDEWTQAVNAHGAFGRWRWAVAKEPAEIRDILLQVKKETNG
jgi:type III restriction enzyme